MKIPKITKRLRPTSEISSPTPTPSAMPGHYCHLHLLLRTGAVPIATVMRRVVTRHAIYFNRRRRRYGHLFQNRYESILCQEDPYFLEVVRYIHLNPLRAHRVKSLPSLDRYPYAGHSALMGMVATDWQDTEYVLGWFGRRVRSARAHYHDFMKEGMSMGKRPDLIGGGLVRSAGGWLNLIEMRRAKVFVKGDERILGDGDFVEQIVQEAGEAMASLSKRLNLSPAAVTQSAARGERLVKEGHYHFP